jgi:hypothetical protein
MSIRVIYVPNSKLVCESLQLVIFLYAQRRFLSLELQYSIPECLFSLNSSKKHVTLMLCTICRYDASTNESSFSVGLQGVKREGIELVKDAVWDTLSRVSRYVFTIFINPLHVLSDCHLLAYSSGTIIKWLPRQDTNGWMIVKRQFLKPLH